MKKQETKETHKKGYGYCMKKKIVATIMTLTMAAGLLTGCGSTQQTTQSEAQTGTTNAEATTGSAAGTEGGSIRVTMSLGEEEWTVMRNKIIPDFEEQYGITVDAVQMEAADVVKQITAMNQAGKMDIDVIAQDVNNLTPLVYGGLVEDLSEYVDQIPEECIGSLAEAGVYDGKTYFMPYRPNAEIDYYNTDMFEKYNLTPPTDWDSLYETAKTLKDQEGIGRLCLKIKMEGEAIDLVEFIRSAGGDPLVLNDEGSVKAFTFLQKLWPELSEDTLTAGFSSTNTYLATDEVYFAPNWPYGANVIVKDGGKTNIAAYEGFSGPEKYVKTLGGEMLGIPTGSQNKEQAMLFINYLESKDVQTTLMKENGWISFRSDVYEECDEWQKPFVEATTKALAAAEPLPHVSYWSDAQQTINDAAKEICVDGKDVKEVLDKYAAQIEAAKNNAQ